MAQIKLTQGQFALVDDSDFDWLNQWKWYVRKSGRNFYAVRDVWDKENKKNIKIHMHRLINNTPDGFETDHINRNGLDNRRINLRTSTHQENCFSPKLSKLNTSGSRGVYFEKFTNKWKAQAMINGRNITLGRFESKLEATFIALKKRKELYGQFA